MNISKQKSLGIALLLQALLYCAYSVISALCTSLGTAAVGIISCLLYGISLAVPIFVYIRLEKIKPTALLAVAPKASNNRTRNTPKLILISVLMIFFGFVTAVTAVNIFSMLTELIFTPVSAPTYGTADFILLFIRNVLFAAVLEEILFRGAVFNACAELSNFKKALLSALLFALMHYSLRSFFYAFAAGIVISYFVIRSGSALVGIAIHFLQNLCTFIFSVLSQALDIAVFEFISNIAFIVFSTLAGIALVCLLTYELIRAKHAPKPARTTEPRGDFPIELIGYTVISGIITVLNF